MDEVDLPAAFEFDLDGRANELLVELRDDGLDGHAVLGRRLDDAHVAQPDERHVQRARDRRGGHAEHVDGGAHLLQPLLVAHAETLLFIDDEQAEVLELEALRQQRVGADEDVDLALLGLLEDVLLLLRGAEAREHLDDDGELRKRRLKLSKCWKQSTVVGVSTATCLPSCTALKAARMATSVLP